MILGRFAQGHQMRMLNYGWRAATLAAFVSVGLGADGAFAQVPPGCVASNPNGAAAGALIGGIAGALLGNAASGRHKAGGTIFGGVAGAAAGAAIGGSAGATPCPEGYAYRGPPPGDEPVPVVARDGDFWYGAPASPRERIAFLRHRIERLDRAGWLSPREVEGLSRHLADIQRQEAAIRDRHDGLLPPDARAQIGDELNDVARRLRWKEYRAEHAED
jgi:hypothetical protein